MYLGKPVISFRHADKVRTSVIHHGTSHKARAEANTLMDEVFESLGPSNVALLDGRDVELHIIPYDKQLPELSEFQKLKGQRSPEGRSYDFLRTTGGMEFGQIIRYAIGEETIIKLLQKPSPFNPGFMVRTSRRSWSRSSRSLRIRRGDSRKSSKSDGARSLRAPPTGSGCTQAPARTRTSPRLRQPFLITRGASFCLIRPGSAASGSSTGTLPCTRF